MIELFCYFYAKAQRFYGGADERGIVDAGNGSAAGGEMNVYGGNFLTYIFVAFSC